MPRTSVRAVASLALAAALAVPGVLHANGRFPSAGYFVAGPGPGSSVLALRTTFGLVLSQDSGRSWGWVCEEALNAVGSFDPSLSIGFDGTLTLGSQSGLQSSRGGCSWAPPRGAPTRGVVDVTEDATGRHVVAVTGPTGDNDALFLSNDGGASWTEGARLPGFFTETVEVAPSRPSRIYVAGFARGGIAVLMRSDDGGVSVREVTRDFRGGATAFISGVDPTNPDVVYVRSAVGLGTMLLRSDDGGATFRELTRTTSEMLGFALSDDGRTVWVGSANRAEGILRSTEGGAFRRVAATVRVRCLRQHAGVLYVCADEEEDGYLLGCSTNGGDRIDPLVSARLLAGPSMSCAAGTPVPTLCGPLWPAQRDMLRMIDASAPAAPVVHDAAAPRPDVPSDALADLTDDLVDATEDLPGDRGSPDAAPTDERPDVPIDATADVAGDATTGMLTDGASDAMSMDVRGDVEVSGDARRDSDGLPTSNGPSCGCRAGEETGSSAWSPALVAFALAARRRQRKPRGSPSD